MTEIHKKLVTDLESGIKANPDAEVVRVQDNSDETFERCRDASADYDYLLSSKKGLYKSKDVNQFMDLFALKDRKFMRYDPASYSQNEIPISELGSLFFPPDSSEKGKTKKDTAVRIRFLPNPLSGIYFDGEYRDGYTSHEEGVRVNIEKWEKLLAYEARQRRYAARTKEDILRAVTLSALDQDNEISEGDVSFLVDQGFIFHPSKRDLDYETKGRSKCNIVPIRFCLPENRNKFETYVSKVKEGYLIEFHKLKLITDCNAVIGKVYSLLKHPFAFGMPIWHGYNPSTTTFSSPPSDFVKVVELAKEFNKS
jgi:hypothetical protein